MMKLPFFKIEYIKIPILNFSDYFTTMTLSYWQPIIKTLEWVYFLNEIKIVSKMPTVHEMKDMEHHKTKYKVLLPSALYILVKEITKM